MIRSWLLPLILVSLAPAAFSQDIFNLQPTSAVAGSPQFTMTVYGEFFIAQPLHVMWNGITGTELAIVGTPTPTQLTVIVPASLLVSPMTNTVIVLNGEGFSNTVNFQVTESVATISNIVPSSAT